MSKLERGDFIRVDWVDTQEDPVGNPEKATLCHRTSYGIYWDQHAEGPMTVLITTTTLDKDGPEQQGYCIYPMANVTKLTLVKKGSKRKKDKAHA